MTQEITTTIIADLTRVGKAYIGKSCQSTILTEISASGRKIISEPQPITDYEIVTICEEPALMITVGDDSVLLSTCFNFSK
jgi:hypothetical protein